MSHFDASKRRLFSLGQGSTQPRPPWSVDEYAWLEACNACGDCIEACETEILIADSRGQARIDFSKGECSFCGRCAQVCQTGAISKDTSISPWQLYVVIGDQCLTRQGIVCQSCGDYCQRAAITYRPQPGGVSIPMVEKENCNGCGACLSICPSRAIQLEDAERGEAFRLTEITPQELSR